jgi:hypothetical protein
VPEEPQISPLRCASVEMTKARAALPWEGGLGPATTFYGTFALSFVISTEAQRSGEISVLTPLPGNVFGWFTA